MRFHILSTLHLFDSVDDWNLTNENHYAIENNSGIPTPISK